MAARPVSVSTLRTLVGAATPAALQLRRAIHQHPEVAGSERETAGRIAASLAPLGVDISTEVGGHGVVATIRGEMAGPAVGFRAELDAVPGDEGSDLPFRSRTAGAAHLCGHDLHAAIAAGMASVLAPLADGIPGTVTLVFQPAEETLQGASAMIAAGVLENAALEAIFALHSWPMPVGHVGGGVNFGFAGLDLVDVTLRGPAATAGTAAAIRSDIEALRTVAYPDTPEAFGALMEAFHTPRGTLTDAVYVETSETVSHGRITVTAAVKAARHERYADVRARIQRLVDRHAPQSAAVTVAREPYPAMTNDPTETDRALAVLDRVMGADSVERYHAISPFNGEDFGLFLQRVPGAMLLLGVADYERGHLGIPHQPDFVADEAALSVGMLAATAVILTRLGLELDA